MIYRVTVLTDGKLYPLYIPGNEDLVLQEPQLTLEMGNSGTFTFYISPTHPHYDKIRLLHSEFFVYREAEELFRGRFAGKEEDFYKIGKVSCEGDLAYLIDSIQRPYSQESSIDQFLTDRLAAHNSQVEERKRFQKGKVGVVDRENISLREEAGYSSTLECLKAKLIKKHGGYLRTRKEKDGRYLDYVTDYGGVNRQKIRFGENLMDLRQYSNAKDVATAIIPLGGSVEYVKADGTKDSKRVDITSVNGGKDYIYDQKAVENYGWINAVREWEDEYSPENLLKKAKTSLNESILMPVTMELTAVDLALLGTDIESFEVGFWTDVLAQSHGVIGKYLLTGRTIYLNDPEKDKIILGGNLPSLTSSTAGGKLDISLKLDQAAQSVSKEINAKIENATQLITGGLGGYVVIERGESGYPEEILIMDAPEKEKANNLLRLNKHGIGFSTSGYNGIYRNAWTIDGNLVADFVTAGSMLADRIRGGILEIGGQGSGKDGEILLKDAQGNILAVLDKNGIDIRKGSISGSTLRLGGAGNVSGRMEVMAADGSVICSAGVDGLFAARGTIGGWKIGADYLETGNGIIRSFEGSNESNRATMNNASLKVWVNGNEKCYMGRGGYNNRGQADSGLLFIAGYGGGIELDGSSGKINVPGEIEAAGQVKARGGLTCEGKLECAQTAKFKGGDGIEVSRDIMCGGNVYAQNISAIQSDLKAIKNKLGM